MLPVLALAAAAGMSLSAQSGVALGQAPSRIGRYLPLDQTAPPGKIAAWTLATRRNPAPYPQPVLVELPTTGTVAFYGGATDPVLEVAAPASAALLTGAVYRLRISDMPEYPGVELYPTVELLDRLHPPLGRAPDFPVPIALTEAEITAALDGRLVTKVVYLEQPQVAVPALAVETLPVRTLDPRENALAEADRAGRPMAVIRLGGRVPDPERPEPGFFGHKVPVGVIPAPRRRLAAPLQDNPTKLPRLPAGIPADPSDASVEPTPDEPADVPAEAPPGMPVDE